VCGSAGGGEQETERQRAKGIAVRSRHECSLRMSL
jgi:hypothetical protein